MALYMIQYDGGQKFVEARSFADAISAWNADMLREFGGGDSGWTGDDEPESVTLLSSGDVVRDA